MKIPQFKTWLVVALLSTGLVACKTAKFEPGGAYSGDTVSYVTNDVGAVSTDVLNVSAPDITLFNLDTAFKLAYNIANTAFEAERNNRKLLFDISPDIKHTLDNIRPQAVEAVTSYTKFRRAYLLDPTPNNLSALDRTLKEIQRISTAATGALPAQN